ncbi:ion transporter [Salinibacterium sp. SYSU T00001]|uniref:ion transporter n=1 Tax=Homoserinimonas sedimenticola TaxID=2986805 RepID=UPI00223577CE|nr:ion transporter [Salinibacterium sedimenticola]MCW4385554.1 ion transporter [Salinibacterium sedimenticola]
MSSASTEEHLSRAEVLAARLDRPMGALGVIFLFVVLGQLLASDPTLSTVLTVVGWVFWAIFVAEFLLRAYIARFQAAFWRKNWWQVVFLLVPFLRFFRALQSLRLLRLARVARFGGVISAGVRGTRSAGRLLTSRLAWLAAVTVVVILVSSQLLYLFGVHDSYADALYEAAMATITGTGITADDTTARLIKVPLAVYSVVVFATLAGSLGAFFLDEDRRKHKRSEVAVLPDA